MASTKVTRAAAQLHEAAQDVARVAASRSTQPEDMTMNGRSTGSQHVDGHSRRAVSQPVPGHHRLPSVTPADAVRFAPFAVRWPLRTFLELGALPGAAPCARLHACNVLAEWGLTMFSESTGLLVSQLVTNAIQISRVAEQDAPVRFRDIPLPLYVSEAIDKHVSDYGTTEDGYLFRGRRHKHVTRRTYQEDFERAAARAGLPPEFIAHSLRHCYASTALACGIPITEVSRWLGHKSIEVTHQITVTSCPPPGIRHPSRTARAGSVLIPRDPAGR